MAEDYLGDAQRKVGKEKEKHEGIGIIKKNKNY